MFWFLCCLSNNYTIKREHRQIQKIRGVCWYQQKLPIVQRQQILGSSLPEFVRKIHVLSFKSSFCLICIIIQNFKKINKSVFFDVIMALLKIYLTSTGLLRYNRRRLSSKLFHLT